MIRARIDWDDNGFFSLQTEDADVHAPFVVNTAAYDIYVKQVLDAATTYYSDRYDATRENVALFTPELDEFGMWKFSYLLEGDDNSDPTSLTFNGEGGTAGSGKYKIAFWARYKPSTTPTDARVIVDWAGSDNLPVTITLTDEWQRFEYEFEIVSTVQQNWTIAMKMDTSTDHTLHLEVKGVMDSRQQVTQPVFPTTHTAVTSVWAKYEDVSDDVLSVNWNYGIVENTSAVASVPKNTSNEGHVTIELSNDDKFYSPDNTGSDLYGAVEIGKRVMLEVYDTINSSWVVVWRGFITGITPIIESQSQQSLIIEASQGIFNLLDDVVTRTYTDETEDDTLTALLKDAPVRAGAYNGGLVFDEFGTYQKRYSDPDFMFGTFANGEVTLDEVVLVDSKVWDTATKVVKEAGGYLWVSPEGKFEYRSKATYAGSPSSNHSVALGTEAVTVDYEYRFERVSTVKGVYTEKKDTMTLGMSDFPLRVYMGNRYWESDPSFTGNVSAVTVKMPYDRDYDPVENVAVGDYAEWEIPLPSEYTDTDGKVWSAVWEEGTTLGYVQTDGTARASKPQAYHGYPRISGYGVEDDYDAIFDNALVKVNGGSWLDITPSNPSFATISTAFPIEWTVTGNTCTVRVYNSYTSAVDFYLMSVGVLATLEREVTYEVGSSPVINEIAFEYINTPETVEDVVDDILAAVPAIGGFIRGFSMKDTSSTQLEKQLAIKVGDVVSLTDIQSGLTDVKHIVIHVQYDWTNNVLTSMYTLRKL